MLNVANITETFPVNEDKITSNQISSYNANKHVRRNHPLVAQVAIFFFSREMLVKMKCIEMLVGLFQKLLLH